MKTQHILRMERRHLDYARVEESLVAELHEYCRKSGQKGFVVGVSGGVDSAVVSALCAKTGLSVTVIEMPIHQRGEEVNRARVHIDWLRERFPNVTSVTADLTHVFETFEEKIHSVTQGSDTYLALVNTRSRLRMVMLYALGNAEKLLVVGTGNKVEDYGIGFFTKYGDGGVDLSPIGNLYKSEVRSLGKHMAILPLLTEAVATDGLHTDGATDEDQIGASYDELEWAMVEYDHGRRAGDYTDRACTVMEIYTRRHEGNAHKMAMPPVFSFPVPL